MKKIYNEKVFFELKKTELKKINVFILNLTRISKNNTTIIVTQSNFYNSKSMFMCLPFYKNILH